MADIWSMARTCGSCIFLLCDPHEIALRGKGSESDNDTSLAPAYTSLPAGFTTLPLPHTHGFTATELGIAGPCGATHTQGTALHLRSHEDDGHFPDLTYVDTLQRPQDERM
jgi:hypothetical protein